jgi:hypothetical protein
MPSRSTTTQAAKKVAATNTRTTRRQAEEQAATARVTQAIAAAKPAKDAHRGTWSEGKKGWSIV